MTLNQKILRILVSCFLFCSTKSLWAFNNRINAPFEINSYANQEQWPELSSKYRSQRYFSLEKGEASEVGALVFEGFFPLNQFWKLGFEWEAAVYQFTGPKVKEINSYNLSLAYTQILLKGYLLAQSRVSSGFSLGNGYYGSFYGANISASLELDFFVHPWIAFSSELGYKQHYLLSILLKDNGDDFLKHYGYFSIGLKTLLI